MALAQGNVKRSLELVKAAGQHSFGKARKLQQPLYRAFLSLRQL